MKQINLTIQSQGRGYYLITNEIQETIKNALSEVDVGLLHVFLQHSSASITINENADPTVREDFKNFEEKLVPRSFPYKHNYEGDDDMPAHIKSSILGASVSVPISDGQLNLGTWQGICLCEHRDHGGRRTLVVTVQGETF